jgi:hypothetical protein
VAKQYRIQILFDEKQYRYLKNYADRDGISLSDALRNIVDKDVSYAPGTVNEGVKNIKDVCHDVTGLEQESVLYKNK